MSLGFVPPPPATTTLDSNIYIEGGKRDMEFLILIDGFVSVLYIQSDFIQYQHDILKHFKNSLIQYDYFGPVLNSEPREHEIYNFERMAFWSTRL